MYVFIVLTSTHDVHIFIGDNGIVWLSFARHPKKLFNPRVNLKTLRRLTWHRKAFFSCCCRWWTLRLAVEVQTLAQILHTVEPLLIPRPRTFSANSLCSENTKSFFLFNIFSRYPHFSHTYPGPMLGFFKYFCRKIQQKIGDFVSKQSQILKKS
jgi:hypothetical protein